MESDHRASRAASAGTVGKAKPYCSSLTPGANPYWSGAPFRASMSSKRGWRRQSRRPDVRFIAPLEHCCRTAATPQSVASIALLPARLRTPFSAHPAVQLAVGSASEAVPPHDRQRTDPERPPTASAWDVGRFSAATPSPTAMTLGVVSDSGSGMGAAGDCQLRSEAVTVPDWKPLTCGNVAQQRVCQVGRSVRIEGVRGSNPLSSTLGYRQNCRCCTDRTGSVTVSYCACRV